MTTGPVMTAATEDVVPRMSWDDGMLLGYAPMDRVHEDFVQCVTAVQSADEATMAQCMTDLIEHARSHFGQEDDWMRQTGFPARECHINEHAAVLQSLFEAQALLAKGNHDICRRVANELARWFPGHADYLDAALAHWMCKRDMGGKPVVLRPSLARRLAQDGGA